MKSILNEKNVLITGASSGIGLACAERFAAEGANLILCARRLSKLQEIAHDLQKTYGVRIFSSGVDVRDRSAVEKWFDSIPADFRPVEILVNNAGLALGLEKVQNGDPEDWDTMIDTNIKGLLYLTRIFLKNLPLETPANIVNIGSVAGIAAYPNGAVYCATKAAVRFISDAVRMETVERPIRVTNIQPGFVETEFSIVRFHGDSGKAKDFYRGIKPLTGPDIADAVLYAVSAPSHVQITEITITATHQASATVVYRKEGN